MARSNSICKSARERTPKNQLTAPASPEPAHCRSTQTASGKNEGLLGCEEKGRSQTQIEGSEQTQEEGQSRVTVITAEFEV